MKIVADVDIPFLAGVFEPYGEVLYKKGIEISREDIVDADALIVRTRTRCDASLLEGTSVKMIATATIGMDHIDVEYCRNNGIEVANAVYAPLRQKRDDNARAAYRAELEAEDLSGLFIRDIIKEGILPDDPRLQ